MRGKLAQDLSTQKKRRDKSPCYSGDKPVHDPHVKRKNKNSLSLAEEKLLDEPSTSQKKKGKESPLAEVSLKGSSTLGGGLFATSRSVVLTSFLLQFQRKPSVLKIRRSAQRRRKKREG
ncbi:hypothetical protein AMTR_s00096p00141110 [Amborella trichopoda]|uniref:Uncharacterized protein n=1 Tax=Amborella trichopoda TaxID=13333 RepID=W1P4A9_AMBTC|nr:hypothetical protein AMTR_s00096p00141110 [Amborella trichopoda]